MSDVLRVNFSLSDVGVRPESGEFEQRCLEVASTMVADEISGWANGPRVVDIDIQDDDVVVLLGERSVSRVEVAEAEMAVGHLSLVGDEPCCDGCDTTCEAEVCDHDEVTDDPMDIPIENSVAWQGPLAGWTFEIGVIDLCAILDLMGFAQQLSQATHAISPTIARSMHKLEMMLAETIGEPVEGGGTRPSEGFLEHMNIWMKESTEMFDQVAKAQQRKVVRAKMMPGPDFDPTGGTKGQQGPPPLFLR